MDNFETKSRVEVVVIDEASDINNSQQIQSSSILTRLHAGYFRMSIALGAQALLWKVLSQPKNDPQAYLHVFHKLPSTASLLLWFLSLITLVFLSTLYILRCFFHFPMVKAEFKHPIGVNFFYAPWISWLLLLESAPLLIFPNKNNLLFEILCWVFTVPVLILDLKIYGQWFTTEKRFLSVVANPTSQLSVIGNLVAAQVIAKMGWKESAVSVISLGMAHYLILFVTLYQRLLGGNRFPAMLRPAFFLFFAAPSFGSLAWSSVSGSIDTCSKMLFFLSLFLFISLVCRPNLFKKSMRRFNVAWWSYSLSLTFLALASSEYAREVKGRSIVSGLLMLVLSVISVLVFLGLMLLTTLNTDRLFRENDPVVCFTCDNGIKTRIKC